MSKGNVTWSLPGAVIRVKVKQSGDFFASFLAVIAFVNFYQGIAGGDQDDPERKGFSCEYRTAEKIAHIDKATDNCQYP
jgi:hypothetical protein